MQKLIIDYFNSTAESITTSWKRVFPKKKKGGIGSRTLRGKNNKSTCRLTTSPGTVHHAETPKKTRKQLQRRCSTLERNAVSTKEKLSNLRDKVAELESLLEKRDAEFDEERSSWVAKKDVEINLIRNEYTKILESKFHEIKSLKESKLRDARAVNDVSLLTVLLF